MAVLYVDEQGAEVRVTGRRILVTRDGETLKDIRIRDLERVVLFGPVDFTTPAMHALIDAGVETTFLSAGGAYRGRLAAAEGKNVLLRRVQFRRADDAAFRLEMARTILSAKLANCRYVILRYARNHPSEKLDAAALALADAVCRMTAQTDVQACMGVEGAGARLYFEALGSMVRREFAFTERTRRPPRDPVNSLLSFGYALLTSEIVGALASQGLDPDAGFVHSIEYGRPALALDLLEEFRPVVADRVALNLVNNAVLDAAHFEQGDDGGVRMTEEGRAKYLQTYHRIMSAEVASRDGQGRTSFRGALRVQAGRIRGAVVGEAAYDPYTPR